MIEPDMLRRSLLTMLDELLEGPSKEAAWVLNPGDRGMLAALDALSAEEASAVAPGGGSSVAAHVDHLRCGFDMLTRWFRGEEPFADADYSASWRRGTVSDDEWTSSRAALRRDANAWRDAFQHQLTSPTLTDVQLNAILSSIVHLAYHAGAIRQIQRSTCGPIARD